MSMALHGVGKTYIVYNMKDTFFLQQVQETQMVQITLTSAIAKQVADFITEQLQREETKNGIRNSQ